MFQTFYEEEVGDSGESAEGCIVLTDLSKSYVSLASQVRSFEDSQVIANYRVKRTNDSAVPYTYNPLTPP